MRTENESRPAATALRRPHHASCSTADGKRLTLVDPAVVQQLKGMLRAQTSECVMATLGIGMNTWVKLRDGMPIRASVAERLLDNVIPGAGKSDKRDKPTAIALDARNREAERTRQF